MALQSLKASITVPHFDSRVGVVEDTETGQSLSSAEPSDTVPCARWPPRGPEPGLSEPPPPALDHTSPFFSQAHKLTIWGLLLSLLQNMLFPHYQTLAILQAPTQNSFLHVPFLTSSVFTALHRVSTCRVHSRPRASALCRAPLPVKA